MVASSGKTREGVGTDDQPFQRLPVGWWCNLPAGILCFGDRTPAASRSSRFRRDFCSDCVKDVLFLRHMAARGFVENSRGSPVS